MAVWAVEGPKAETKSFANVERLLHQYRQLIDVISGQERYLDGNRTKRIEVGRYISRSEECNYEHECIRKTNGS